MKFLTTLFTFSVLLYLVGCGEKESNPQQNTPSVTTESAKTSGEIPLRYSDYEREISYTEPRIQFVSKYVGAKEKGIFSMNIDGTDRRLVIGANEMFDGARIDVTPKHTPKRSPDNRYIIGTFSKNDGEEKFIGLLDLKDRLSTRIIDISGAPYYTWIDNENVAFYQDFKLKNYNIVTAEITSLPMIHSRGLYFDRARQVFIAVQDDGITIHERDGSEAVSLPKHDILQSQNPNSFRSMLSFDRKTLLLHTSGQNLQLFVLSTESGEIIKRYPDSEKMKLSGGNKVFIDSENLQVFKKREIITTNLISDEQTFGVNPEYRLWRTSALAMTKYNLTND